jgi:membrane associated rhomboid family serine protease
MPVITYLIIGFTAIVSFMAFNNPAMFHNLKHYPYAEKRDKEYYRWLTGGFLHGDMMHLIFNMLTLYFFGGFVESFFRQVFPGVGALVYLLFYLLAVVAASVGTYYKHQDHRGFASIGASGAVAAVLFAAILLQPTIGIGFLFIPIPIPGFIFAILYLWYSSYAANRSGDNIDHMAHFYGAVFGFCFPLLVEPSLLRLFFVQLSEWFASI